MAKAKMGAIFSTFLIIILGLALTPNVADSVFSALHNASGTGASNVSGTSAAIIPLVTVMWVFLVIGIGAAAVYVQFKGMD